MTIAANPNNESEFDSLDIVAYQDAFEFILGRIEKVESLTWRHSSRKFRAVDKKAMYALAVETCWNVLSAREAAETQLAAFIDARLRACKIAALNSEEASTSPDTGSLHKFTTIVFSFVQSRCSLAEVKKRLDSAITLQISEETV